MVWNILKLFLCNIQNKYSFEGISRSFASGEKLKRITTFSECNKVVVVVGYPKKKTLEFSFNELAKPVYFILLYRHPHPIP